MLDRGGGPSFDMQNLLAAARSVLTLAKTEKMNPIFQFDDFLTKANFAPREFATAAVGLSAVILAFGYFTLGWSTNRMKEADDSHRNRRGSPALVCWTSAAGTTLFTILGTHFFAPLYFAMNTNIYIWHALPCLAIIYIWFYYWRVLVKLLLLHRRTMGQMSPFTQDMLDSIQDYRHGLWMYALALFVIFWSMIIETLIGDFPAGIMSVCFLLVAVAGLGCYVSLSGDLFARALDVDATCKHRDEATSQPPLKEEIP